jgi:hypothetical protein
MVGGTKTPGWSLIMDRMGMVDRWSSPSGRVMATPSQAGQKVMLAAVLLNGALVGPPYVF